MAAGWTENRVVGSHVAGSVVQLGSGTVTLALERPDHRLDWLSPGAPRAWLPKHQRTPSYLLDARRETVPYRPRPAVQAHLTDWLDDPDAPMSVLLVHGAGGRGKTRLANAFATVAHASGWAVAEAVAQRTTTPAAPRTTRPDKVLVVADYAERWSPTSLVEMIRALPADFPGSTVRVLLLARSTAVWPQLTADLDRVPTDLPDPVELGDLTAPDDRVQAFTDAAEAFARALGAPAATAPDLSDDAYGSALTLHMAALAAVCAQRDDDPRPTLANLSTYLLHHERRFWPADRFEQTADAVFVATLFGPTDTATALLARAGVADGEAARDLVRRHDHLYPEGGFAPLRPDRFGEDFVADHLTTPRAARIVERLFTGEVRQPLIVLAAAADRHEHVRPVLWSLLTEHDGWGRHAGEPLIRTVIDHAPYSVAGQVYVKLPEYHTGLLRPSVELARYLMEHFPPDAPPQARAQMLMHVSGRLGDLGDHQGELEAALRCADIFEDLVTRGLPHLHDLADAFHSVGGAWSSLHEHERALEAVEKAEVLRRHLANLDPASHLPELARLLRTIGRIRAQAGDEAGAMRATEEVIDILRAYPDPGLLAAAHNTLSNLEAALGDRRAAFEAAAESIRLNRLLAVQDPEVHLPALANDYLTLAWGQLIVGPPPTHLPEALRAARKGLELYDALARQEPEVFGPRRDHAVELVNEAQRQLDLVQDSE
ncbi:hypothetical protein AB0K14_04195 [Actinosynnema sp. NPDC050801]|uniref:hypothetical protein n=1 Tax=unclassified Actinosynnema TaxID=2637065 RepID=UPI0033F1B478